MNRTDSNSIPSSAEAKLDGSPPGLGLDAVVRLLLAALDAASEAIVIVDAQLAVAFHNRAAKRAFGVDAYMVLQDARLAIGCPADRAAMQSAIAAAIAEDKVTALKMHDRKGATVAFCRVLPVAADAAPYGAPQRLALVVCRSADVAPEQIRAVCELYGLSQAECRVGELLAGGASPQKIAGALGCSIHTVRAHLKQIFYKTNTSRQSELIALVRTALP